MTSPLKRAIRRAGMGLGIFAAAASLGAFGAHQLANDSETVETTAEAASSDGWVAADETLACTIYDAPSLVYPGFPRSSLANGAAYVIICENSTGSEVVNELFLHQMPDN